MNPEYIKVIRAHVVEQAPNGGWTYRKMYLHLGRKVSPGMIRGAYEYWKSVVQGIRYDKGNQWVVDYVRTYEHVAGQLANMTIQQEVRDICDHIAKHSPDIKRQVEMRQGAFDFLLKVLNGR